MKTFSATDARNRFGEFLDSGMVEGVRVVRNNRVLGYFVPEREYEELRRAARSDAAASHQPTPGLRASQLDTLSRYCAVEITGSEAKADLGCDRRGLIALVARNGFMLPHMAQAQAETMAEEALAFIAPATGKRPRDQATDSSAPNGR